MKNNVIQMGYESMQDFAERTGIKYCSIRKFCMCGKLPFVPVGKRRMIPIERGLKALEAMEADVRAGT